VDGLQLDLAQGDTLKQLASLGGVAGLAVFVLVSARGDAAEPPDSQTLGTSGMADLTDVYAWMSGANLNLVMDVSPNDDGTHRFGPSVQYVFHLTNARALPATGGGEARVIVQFASDTSVEAWLTDASGTREYVQGDPSGQAGIASNTAKLRVFAGRRSDPFFFNAGGFTSAITAINNLVATRPPASDPAGCLLGLPPAEAIGLRTLLATGNDAFAQANVMAIVVAIDKSLVATSASPTVAVWGSTHAGG
jgi:hypothetical protein